MTSIAIAFMALAMAVVWGGLAASAWWLRRHPEPDHWPED
jgi:ABC-type spermidine/putrescine transport system permease subunit II